ncbi:MAG: enoyl-CoA hydratase/isomerase family protein [Dehalococcoidia bacterium]
MSAAGSPDAPEILVADADGVRTLTLNRPDRLNALTLTMRAAIAEAVTAFDRDDELRVLVLTGAGRGFCSGADLSGQGEVVKQGPKEWARHRFWWHRPFDDTEKPTICALNGVAAGAGLGLALSCDVIVASDAATIAPATARLGLSPDNGVAQRLVRRVGYPRALKILLLARTLPAGDAHALGIVDDVVPAADFVAAVAELARAFAAVPMVTAMLTKRLLRDAPGLPREVELAYEELLLQFAAASPEAAAARAAYARRQR